MRIAVVTTSYPAFPGDPSGHFVETEARVLARDAEVVVITPGESRPEREPGGFVVVRCGGGAAFGWPGAATRIRVRPWLVAPAVAWMHRARAKLSSLGRFDRVVAHWALPSAFPVAHGLGAPVEIVSHGADVRLLARLPGTVRRAVMARLFATTTTWRFVSRGLLDDLAATLDANDRTTLARLAFVESAAIDLPDVATHASRPRREHDDSKLLVCVGRLVAGKRFHRALEHVARENQRGERSRVVIVGDGPEKQRLEARARALGVDASFVGRTTRGEALAWIGAADTLLHASRAEGCSTVVREAEALGVPVLRVD